MALFKPSDILKVIDTNHPDYAALTYNHGGGNTQTGAKCYVDSIATASVNSKYRCMSIDGKHSFSATETQLAKSS